MKYKYDQESDVLLIMLHKGKPDFAEQKDNVIAHYTKDGTPIEIEILDARDGVANIEDASTQETRYCLKDKPIQVSLGSKTLSG